jgi:PLP dependent protein
MFTSRLLAALPQVRDRIAAAAERSGRDAADVRLVAVTKGHPVDVVEAALASGLRDLAENRLEALQDRVPRFEGAGCRWHMVGHLQRRKAPEVRGLVHLLHSLDSVKLAERLDRTAPEDQSPLPVLVQVNTSGEDSKGGFDPENAVEGVGRVLEMKSLDVRGLMTMAPYTASEATLRRTFGGLRRLSERLGAELSPYDGPELSMGMSNDYELAIEEGSTMVRLGTVLFGEREK